ncbi:agmatinase [Prochlorococcus marinus str. NATL2A]|uniref:Agmatinase n=1 Tax=Prochlorococcus marinus (strain NATL2A) TaxID=59920 RepID=Q46IA1_PROMT|nr:agmatinase [Prochlorococcus marinus]AAZ58777.1 agmatinase [Prochlorococcus marinus str. NATL2A]
MTKSNLRDLSLFNNDGAIFMGAQRDIDQSRVSLLGVPYDGTCCFRPGARFGPSAIREDSYGIETYCPQLDLDLEDINFTDIGSLDVPLGDAELTLDYISDATNILLKNNLKPLIIGGEHSITIGIIKSIITNYPDLIMLQLDAHADLRDEWLGSKLSHACTMKRCLEILPSKKIFQIGIRSGTKSEFLEMNNSKRFIQHTLGENAKSLEEALKSFKGRPIYLTFDLDWFDPSVMPGTGTPEPGGYFWGDFAAIINVIKSHNLIGADVVELSPKLDTTGISSILAAKVIRSLIMLLDKSS